MHNRIKLHSEHSENGRQEHRQAMIINQYRSLIMPDEFHIKTIDTYGSISPIELQSVVELHLFTDQQLTEIIVDTLKLWFIYEPIILALRKQNSKLNQFILKDIMRVLIRGQFYRFLNNVENPLKILINNRTTQANIKILIASLLLYSLNRMSLKNIEIIMLIFTLEASFYDQQRLTMPLENLNILRALKKLDRSIKPIDFKIWQENFKNSKDFKPEIQAHHFIYLCSLTEKKTIKNNLFKFNFSSLFKTTNKDGKTVERETKQAVNEMKEVEERKVVRGLSFVENTKKFSSCAKELLRQIRLRNPSRGKRPNTSLLRRNMSEHIDINLITNYNPRISLPNSQHFAPSKTQKPKGFCKTIKKKASKYMVGESQNPFHSKLKINSENPKLSNKMIPLAQNMQAEAKYS